MKNIQLKLWGIFLILLYLLITSIDFSSLNIFGGIYSQIDADILNIITTVFECLLALLPIVGIILFIKSSIGKSKDTN